MNVDLTDLPRTLSAIWNFKQIEKRSKRILDAKYIEQAGGLPRVIIVSSDIVGHTY